MASGQERCGSGDLVVFRLESAACAGVPHTARAPSRRRVTRPAVPPLHSPVSTGRRRSADGARRSDRVSRTLYWIRLLYCTQ